MNIEHNKLVQNAIYR